MPLWNDTCSAGPRPVFACSVVRTAERVAVCMPK